MRKTRSGERQIQAARGKNATPARREAGNRRAGESMTRSLAGLQSSAGNRAVQRLLQRSSPPVTQAAEDETTFNIPGVSLPSPGGGKVLPEEVRGKMESAFQQDFSAVRIHEGSAASSVGALAFTRGSDIHFARGQYQPDSKAGQSLIGHELTHVVQQRAGIVKSPSGGDGAPVNADPALEAEADRVGARAAEHRVAEVSSASQASAPGNGSQLQEEDDDFLQGSFETLQRQDEEEWP